MLIGVALDISNQNHYYLNRRNKQSVFLFVVAEVSTAGEKSPAFTLIFPFHDQTVIGIWYAHFFKK